MKYWLETFISHLKKNEKVSKKMSATISKAYKFFFYSSPILEYVLTLASLFMFIYYFVHNPRITHFGARI